MSARLVLVHDPHGVTLGFVTTKPGEVCGSCGTEWENHGVNAWVVADNGQHLACNRSTP